VDETKKVKKQEDVDKKEGADDQLHGLET